MIGQCIVSLGVRHTGSLAVARFRRASGLLTRGLAVALACGLAWSAPLTRAAEPGIAPEAARFKLGALDIAVLRDSAVDLPNDGSTFGLNATPAEVAGVLRQAGAATDKVHLDIDALLIRMPDHLVLIDAGYGPANHGMLKKSLASIKVSAADITDVLITHSHPDHVGGLVDGKQQPAFPKAVIRMSAAEWAHMQSGKAGSEVAAIKSRVRTFTPGQQLLPGITPIALYGHTPGHVGYRITSGGHSLMDIGDLAHSSIVSLAKPGWTIAWDADKVQGVNIRQRELKRLADTGDLMFAPHFPFPGVGKIQAVGEGYRFEPGLPVGDKVGDR